MSTMTSPIISNIKISEMAKTQTPPQKVNFRISEVTVGDEVNEYGKVQVNLYFDVELGGKGITINKRLMIKPDTFTAENSAYVGSLLKKFQDGRKQGLDKESNKARFTSDEWRDLWAYSFEVEQILNPLFKLACSDEPNFDALVGVQGNASVGRDQKDFLTVLKVNGKVK
jgi:hypothetical protein